MMIPDGFVIPVGYSQADSNSCVDPCRVFHCDGNCFAFLTVFWKPTGTNQTDRNLPVSGSVQLLYRPFYPRPFEFFKNRVFKIRVLSANR